MLLLCFIIGTLKCTTNTHTDTATTTEHTHVLGKIEWNAHTTQQIYRRMKLSESTRCTFQFKTMISRFDHNADTFWLFRVVGVYFLGGGSMCVKKYYAQYMCVSAYNNNAMLVMCLGAKKQREIKTCLKFDGIRVMLLLLPRHDWTSAMKTTRENDTEETWRVRVFVYACACACVCVWCAYCMPLYAVAVVYYTSFSYLPFRLNVRPARLLLWCWWWRRRRQQQQRRLLQQQQRRRRQWEMMKSQTEVLATQAYNNNY